MLRARCSPPLRKVAQVPPPVGSDVLDLYPGLADSAGRLAKLAGLTDAVSAFGKSLRTAGTEAGAALRAKGVANMHNAAGDAVAAGTSAGKGSTLRPDAKASWGDTADVYASRLQRGVGAAIEQNPEAAAAAGGGLAAYGGYRAVRG